jgi:hypothetical protein
MNSRDSIRHLLHQMYKIYLKIGQICNQMDNNYYNNFNKQVIQLRRLDQDQEIKRYYKTKLLI